MILLRILQGLALGGEYGGAAIYVSEHADRERRGYFSSYIQAGVVGGFVLSVAVVLLCQSAFADDTFAAWGCRVPFVLSIVLLAVSLWMRLKLSESPVFVAMKEAGHTARNPFVESFTYPGNKKRIFVALFGVTGVLTTIWYTAFFSALSFLKGPMRMDTVTTEIIVGIAALVSMGFYLMVGKWSDKVGRKLPIVIGAAATLVLLFGFQGRAITAQPLVIAMLAVPIVIQVYLNAGIAYGLSRWLKVPHCVAGPAALIGASNFFELAVAAAISIFGLRSGAALATVVGVLVEVPVMLSVVRIVNRTSHWFDEKSASSAVSS